MEEIQEVPEITEEIKTIVKMKKNTKPKNPKYFNEYYHKNKDKVVCQFCNALVCRLTMFRHVQGKKCLMVQNGERERPEENRIKQLLTIEEKMFRILDNYFESKKLENKY